MNSNDVIQVLFYIGVLTALVQPVGYLMEKIFSREKIGFCEKIFYKICRIDSKEEMTWIVYMNSLLAFNFIGFTAVYLPQVLQNHLPLNPQNLSSVSWHSSLNTAISFMTNTNWQGYAGETTMSYFTQMAGLTTQNFVSAATGIAVFLALVRGLVRRSSKTLGNFWVDLTRSTIYVLLPLSFIFAVLLVNEGVIQNFSPYVEATTMDGAKQNLPMGPAASQIAIKQIGTNGGGVFNANSAHPFENPTPFSNFLEMLALLLLPAALTYTFGRMVKSVAQGWTVFGVMLFLFVIVLVGSLVSEFHFNLMEGKETRFGIVNSVLWSTATTAASNGSVNAMHSSLSPLTGGLAMFNIMLGEIIFGGVGAGMYGMLLFVLLTVFLAGLMVGRTPEYLGKKVEAFEMKMAILAILAPCAIILVGSAVSSVLPIALSSLANKGPHGLSEILYAFSSAAGNNGSAFAGLNANTVYYNLFLGLAMLVGRFAIIVPVLAIAGSMVQKKYSPPSSGTFPTDSFLFALLLVGVILIVGALTFLPALSLGPIVEHFLLLKGVRF